MGSKGSSSPPPVAPPPPVAQFDPTAIIGPMFAAMQQLVGQFAQQQTQLIQALQLPAPNIPDFQPEAFDLAAERESIREKLETNPSESEFRRRGRASTKVVSPLADDEADFDILKIKTAAGTNPNG